MRTLTQTFTAATTWKLNMTGRYFTLLSCTLAVNVRFYNSGKMLDLGEINNVLAGIECMPADPNAPLSEPAFDRVEIDVSGADTVKIGIGNGQARNSAGAVTISGIVPVTLSNPEQTFGFSTAVNSTAVANTPIQLLAPASNINGAIIFAIACAEGFATAAIPYFSVLAKASAPANITDGDVLLTPDNINYIPTGTYGAASGKLSQVIKIAAGKGVYFYPSVASYGMRSIAGRLL